MKIKVYKDYYDDKVNLYESDELNLNQGITVLCGCNGSGKSTLLRIIESHCKKEDINLVIFDNLTDGGDTARQKALNKGAMSFLATQSISSEGENINNNIGNVFSELGAKIALSVHDKLVVLFDAVDSGLDVHYMKEMSKAFKEYVLPDCKSNEIEIYIIISTNSYEFCIGNTCIDVSTLQPIEFRSYDEYRDFICKSYDKKIERYKKINEKAKRKTSKFERIDNDA